MVEAGVDYLLSQLFPSGNLPSSLESAGHDKLVQWCHGAPGFVHLLANAYKVAVLHSTVQLPYTRTHAGI